MAPLQDTLVEQIGRENFKSRDTGVNIATFENRLQQFASDNLEEEGLRVAALGKMGFVEADREAKLHSNFDNEAGGAGVHYADAEDHTGRVNRYLTVGYEGLTPGEQTALVNEVRSRLLSNPQTRNVLLSRGGLPQQRAFIELILRDPTHLEAVNKKFAALMQDGKIDAQLEEEKKNLKTTLETKKARKAELDTKRANLERKRNAIEIPPVGGTGRGAGELKIAEERLVEVKEILQGTTTARDLPREIADARVEYKRADLQYQTNKKDTTFQQELADSKAALDKLLEEKAALVTEEKELTKKVEDLKTKRDQAIADLQEVSDELARLGDVATIGELKDLQDKLDRIQAKREVKQAVLLDELKDIHTQAALETIKTANDKQKEFWAQRNAEVQDQQMRYVLTQDYTRLLGDPAMATQDLGQIDVYGLRGFLANRARVSTDPAEVRGLQAIMGDEKLFKQYETEFFARTFTARVRNNNQLSKEEFRRYWSSPHIGKDRLIDALQKTQVGKEQEKIWMKNGFVAKTNWEIMKSLPYAQAFKIIMTLLVVGGAGLAAAPLLFQLANVGTHGAWNAAGAVGRRWG